MVSKKTIKVGVVGLGRGRVFAYGAQYVGMELVALCDTWAERVNQFGKELKVTTYTDFDKFLEHDMDAVVLANCFHEHAPFAIKALKAGKHVMSETAACFTLAEGVELIEAVEKSGKIYMFSENYPYMVFNQEMRRLYQSGTMGKFQYGEGEYVHPIYAESHNSISCGVNHWRNWLPYIYYSTHALAPVMYVTDTWPVKVNGFVIPYDPEDTYYTMTARRNDPAWVMMLQMDNGALVRLIGLYLHGEGNWYRFHCSRGLMENIRDYDKARVRIHREAFDKKENEPVEQTYFPDFPEHQEEAEKAGHGGGDFFPCYHFANAIRTGVQPYMDVYRGVTMSIVGPLGYRSALQNSSTIDIPDFRDKSVRAKYAKDDWNPDPSRRKEGYPWPSILGDITPPAEGLARAKKKWKEMGYHGE